MKVAWMETKPYRQNTSLINAGDSKADPEITRFIIEKGYYPTLPVCTPEDKSGETLMVTKGGEIVRSFEDAGHKIIWVFVVNE